jgi:serine/threonine protein kinase/Tol biopolymer transport system component
MALAPGARLASYEILAPLGAGGMGEVYKAVDTRLDRVVAIKVLPAHLASDAQFRERFNREARIISTLDHPHICALYDVGEVAGPHATGTASTPIGFLVMPYLAGETLASRLLKGPLPVDQVLRYATQIADALDKAHRRGVVHRDLKPGNVMLTKDGAKLLDFGLATIAPSGSRVTVSTSNVTMMPPPVADEGNLTGQGALLGTLPYMAPEQLEGAEADARSDVFAFGAMVYEMATGRRAFDARSQMSLMATIIGHDPPLVSATQPLSSPLLDHLVKTCLLKDPDARWQTMADVLIQLKLIADVRAPRTGAVQSSKPLLVVSAATAALVAGVVVGWLVSSSRTGPAPATFTFDVDNVTQGVGAPLQFALSPDGAHLVSVVGSDKGSVLSLRTLTNQATQTLAGTEGAANPFWAPDSRSIGFFADGKLKTVDIFGAPPQTLADAPRNAGGTWSRSGGIVFSTNVGPLLHVSPASGGSPAAVTAIDKSGFEIAHRFPSFLPDGRRFLYLAISSSSQDSVLYAGSLVSMERTRILATGSKALFSPSRHLLFMRDDGLMAQPFDPERLVLSGDPVTVAGPIGANIQNSAAGFTISDTGVLAYRSRDARNRQLAVLDRTGAQVGVFGQLGFHSNPAVSPDFARVAVRDGSTDDIWILDRARGSTSRFTFDRASDNAPVWSPDGQRVVFASNRNGTFDLYQKQAAGGQEELLLRSEQPKMPEDWSRDGRWLLYRTQGERTNADLWMLRIDEGRTPEPVLTSAAEEREGRFSPDGRWLAFVSSESGSLQVFVQALSAAGPKRQVSIEGGHQPRWRGDGKELFFLSETRDAMAVSITEAGGTLEIGTPQRLFPTTAASFAERNSWEVARDGQSFVVNSVPIQRAPITVVVNWLQGMARASFGP